MRSPTAIGVFGASRWPLASLIRPYTCFEKKCIVTVFSAAADAPTATTVTHATTDAVRHVIRPIGRSPYWMVFPEPAPRAAGGSISGTTRLCDSGFGEPELRSAASRIDRTRQHSPRPA